MSRFRLLALDIDGTLVNSQHELTDAVRAAIWRAKSAGMQVAIATGRRYSRALPLVEPLGLHLPLITASGALIKDPQGHATLFRARFAEGVLPALLARVEAAGRDAVLYTDSFAEGFDYYHGPQPPREPMLEEFLRMNPGCGRAWPELTTSPPPEVFGGFAMGQRQPMLELAADLEARLGPWLYVHVLRSPRYAGHMCEIAPIGCTKWSGVRRLARQFGIRDDEICAVGDDVNDIPMIQGAGLGVAMGNATDDVKAHADRIAPSHDSDGLVEVVNWLLH